MGQPEINISTFSINAKVSCISIPDVLGRINEQQMQGDVSRSSTNFWRGYACCRRRRRGQVCLFNASGAGKESDACLLAWPTTCRKTRVSVLAI